MKNLKFNQEQINYLSETLEFQLSQWMEDGIDSMNKKEIEEEGLESEVKAYETALSILKELNAKDNGEWNCYKCGEKNTHSIDDFGFCRSCLQSQ